MSSLKMNPYTLSSSIIKNCNSLMKFLGITESYVIEESKKALSYDEDYIDQYFNLIYDHPSFGPLFSGSNEYVENIQVLLSFYEKFKSHEFFDSFEDFQKTEYHLGFGFYDIITGVKIAEILKNNLIEIKYKDFNFSSAEEMYYSLGAHFSNISSFHNEREVFTKPFLVNDLLIVNAFEDHCHGDFRFFQYDISSTSMTNPFDDSSSLPFSVPRYISGVSAYHSVEASFLSSLIIYAHKKDLFREIVDNDEFLSCIENKSQKYGSYADAGLFMEGFSQSLFGSENPSLIHCEFSGYYTPVIKDEFMEFIHSNGSSGLKLYPEMLSDVIQALFLKVANGNGRSSVKELLECLKFGKEEYLT